MSDTRTNEELAETAHCGISSDCDECPLVACGPGGDCHAALDELLHRADEAAVYKRALELAATGYYPCENIGLVHDINAHRVCPLGRDMAECWTYADGHITATDKRPGHPSCEVQVRITQAREVLTKEADE